MNARPYHSFAMIMLLDDVRQFHQATDTPYHERPFIPHQSRVELRERLITEEVEEFMRASATGDVVEIADALADLVYVALGTALEYGIPLDRVWAEVQRSNMAKLQADGKARKREDGKVLKPEGWTPPDIRGALGL